MTAKTSSVTPVVTDAVPSHVVTETAPVETSLIWQKAGHTTRGVGSFVRLSDDLASEAIRIGHARRATAAEIAHHSHR